MAATTTAVVLSGIALWLLDTAGLLTVYGVLFHRAVAGLLVLVEALGRPVAPRVESGDVLLDYVARVSSE